MKKIIVLLAIGLLSIATISALTHSIKAEEVVIFQDDFETYAVGSFPSAGGWELVFNGRGDGYQTVVDTVSHSPTKSFQLWGMDWWSAVAHRRFSSDAVVIGFEAYILIANYASKPSGSPVAARLMFWNREAMPWGKGYAGIDFTYDGNISTKDIWAPTFGTWIPQTWYEVKLVLDRSVNSFDVWINGILVGDNVEVLPDRPDTYNINAVALFSDHAGVRISFDDVRVFEEQPIIPPECENYAQLAEGRAEAYARYAGAVHYYSADEDFDTGLVQQAFVGLVPIYTDLLQLELEEQNAISSIRNTLRTIEDYRDYLNSLTDPIIEVIDWLQYGAAATLTYSHLRDLENLCRQEADAWRSGDLENVENILNQEEALKNAARRYAIDFRREAHRVDNNAYVVADETFNFIINENVVIANLLDIVETFGMT